MPSTPRVVVVGSLHYDIVVEAPHRPTAGETVTGQAWFPKFGGKGGNQAVAAAKAGANAVMIGAVGNDSFAEFLLERLRAEGVDTGHIATRDDVGSGMSVAIKDATGDYGAVIVSGSNLAIAADEVTADAPWKGAQALILQNEIPEALNIAAARTAREIGVPVIVNVAPYRDMSETFLGLIDVLVVNAIEAEQFGGGVVDSLDAAQAEAERLARRFPKVVVTAGGDGVAVAEGEKSFARPAIKVELVSTHGAGDCFVGTLSVHLARGAGLEQSVDAANKAAAEHVSRPS